MSISQEDTLNQLREMRDFYQDESKRTPGWDSIARGKAIKLWLHFRYGKLMLESTTDAFIRLLIEDLEGKHDDDSQGTARGDTARRRAAGQGR